MLAKSVPVSGEGNKYTSGIDVNEKEIASMPFACVLRDDREEESGMKWEMIAC